jgi:two-component system, NarL family, invasion response regulator UvrY
LTARKRYRLLVVDDHAIVRAGVAAILNQHPELEVGAEAASAADAIQQLASQKFDAVILDLNMPAGSGWELLKNIAKRAGDLPRVLVLSGHREEEYAIQALRHGAAGYLSKDRAPQTLIDAVMRILAGGRYIGDEVATRLADVVLGNESTLAPHETLSPRELAVFRGLAAGASLVAIAAELHVSPKTVTSWRSRVLDKLGINNNAELVGYAIRNGLVERS